MGNLLELLYTSSLCWICFGNIKGMQQRNLSQKYKNVKEQFLLNYTAKFNERGIFTFRDHSLCWYSQGNTNQNFMHQDFKNKYFKASTQDNGIATTVLPESFNCDFLETKKEDITRSQQRSQESQTSLLLQEGNPKLFACSPVLLGVGV